MRISLIVAASVNGVIGRAGGLPWHLPEDFAWFKRVTMGKPVLMGRRTWESIGRVLPGRQNIVLTRRPGYRVEGADVCASIEDAVACAGRVEELMVIGGGELYRAMLPRADRIYLTRVDCEIDGDTFFPEPGEDWEMSVIEQRGADERHEHPFEFRLYEKN
jgi:dihydrofolate reductase